MPRKLLRSVQIEHLLPCMQSIRLHFKLCFIKKQKNSDKPKISSPYFKLYNDVITEKEMLFKVDPIVLARLFAFSLTRLWTPCI